MKNETVQPPKADDTTLEQALLLPPRYNDEYHRLCGKETCDRLVHSKGLCQTHYRTALRLARNGGRFIPGPAPDPSKPRSRHGEVRKNETKTVQKAPEPKPVAPPLPTDVTIEMAAELPKRYNSEGIRICAKDTCQGFQHSKNLCQTHYRTALRLARNGGRKVAGAKPDPTKWRSQWNPNNPSGRKTSTVNWRDHLKRAYNITVEDYDNMLEQQGGLCDICKNDFSSFEKKPHVDHDHATGKVRSILCHHCNLLLGHAKDSPAIIQAAIDYLAKHGITA